MARGRKTALTIRLTAKEHHAIETTMASESSAMMPDGLVRRAKIILLLADGIPISHIADTVGISRRFVYKWAKRFLREGLAGLNDRRSGPSA